MQLGQGLSSEYTRSEKTDTAATVDADRDVTARYYLNSVLQMGEEGIRDAWSKVGVWKWYHFLGLNRRTYLCLVSLQPVLCLGQWSSILYNLNTLPECVVAPVVL